MIESTLFTLSLEHKEHPKSLIFLVILIYCLGSYIISFYRPPLHHFIKLYD